MGETPPAGFRSPAARVFRATVHGVAFGVRAALVSRVRVGDRLLLIPDLPTQAAPQVWVHLPTGEPLGHLPNEAGGLLAPWLAGGGRATATAVQVGSWSVPSWRRLVVEVECDVTG